MELLEKELERMAVGSGEAKDNDGDVSMDIKIEIDGLV